MFLIPIIPVGENSPVSGRKLLLRRLRTVQPEPVLYQLNLGRHTGAYVVADKSPYQNRNLIERAFNKLKYWCRIVTGYDRRSIYYLSALYLVSAVIWG